MIGIVEADADELADLSDAGADARITVHARQRGCIDAAEPLKSGG